MKPILLYYGYYRFDKSDKPVAKYLYEDKDELRIALASRYSKLDKDEFSRRVLPFRCYMVQRGTRYTKIYDKVSLTSLCANGL